MNPQPAAVPRRAGGLARLPAGSLHAKAEIPPNGTVAAARLQTGLSPTAHAQRCRLAWRHRRSGGFIDPTYHRARHRDRAHRLRARRGCDIHALGLGLHRNRHGRAAAGGKGPGCPDRRRSGRRRGVDWEDCPDPAPGYQADRDAQRELAQEYAQGCQERGGDLPAHKNTPDTARDLDVIRAALGDEKLNYLGVSYGTYLGAVYAEPSPAMCAG